MIVDERDKIGLTTLTLVNDHGAVHAVGLPQIVGELGLETSAVFGQGAREVHEVLLMEKAVHRGWSKLHARRHQFPCFHHGDETTDGGAGQLFSHADQCEPGFLVDGSGCSPIGAHSSGESFEFTS